MIETIQNELHDFFSVVRKLSVYHDKRKDAHDLFRGDGYFAGDFPEGVTRKEGVPHPAEIAIYARSDDSEIDRTLVAVLHSAHDGTWRYEGLSPDYTYDVTCEIDGFQGLIYSKARPLSASYIPPAPAPAPEPVYAPMQIRGVLDGGGSFAIGAMTVLVTGGLPPYTLTIDDGAFPTAVDAAVEVQPKDNGKFLVTFGVPVPAGSYTWTWRATDARQVFTTLVESTTL